MMDPNDFRVRLVVINELLDMGLNVPRQAKIKKTAPSKVRSHRGEDVVVVRMPVVGSCTRSHDVGVFSPCTTGQSTTCFGVALTDLVHTQGVDRNGLHIPGFVLLLSGGARGRGPAL